MKRYSWYIIIVWMLLGGPLWAQAPALEVYLSDSVMTVGDPLYVELYLTEADAEMLYIDLAPFQESDWELLEQTRLEEGGLLLTVTNFADRAQLFPPIHIRYQQAGQEKQVSSSPLPVQVNLVAAEEATPGLRPIKEVRPARHASTLWWLIGGLGLLVLILLALLFRRRQKEAALAPFQQLDPRQQCLQQLQALEGQPAQQQAEQAPVALSQLAQTLLG